MEKLREGEGVPHARAAAAEPCLRSRRASVTWHTRTRPDVLSCLVEVETSERDVAHEEQTRRDVAHAW